MQLKDIKKGEEFSYDYGFSFDEDFKNYPCRCKSKNCCGYIVREGSRWRIKKKKKKKNRYLFLPRKLLIVLEIYIQKKLRSFKKKTY